MGERVEEAKGTLSLFSIVWLFLPERNRGLFAREIEALFLLDAVLPQGISNSMEFIDITPNITRIIPSNYEEVKLPGDDYKYRPKGSPWRAVPGTLVGSQKIRVRTRLLF